MRRIYTFLLYGLLPLVLLRLLWRSLRAPAYRRRWRERLGYFNRPLPTDVIWIHAVSVGEVQASQPLVRQLQRRYPQHPILITTTTPTGMQRVAELFQGNVVQVYTPYDLPAVVERFLRTVNPRIVLFVETEIWPNTLEACNVHNIPTVLANARLSARSARGYARIGAFTAQTFRAISVIAAQTQADADRFISLGADPRRVVVTGSIKFEVRLSASLLEHAESIRRTWGAVRPVWIAASTHEGEDGQVLDAHQAVLATFPDALLVLVPRHPERFDQVAGLIQHRGFNLMRRSDAAPCKADTQVFLGDSMGELPMFFAAADVAFVGGSLVPSGGHNMLEPAAVGVPVIVGPHVFNFQEISRLLLSAQGALQVDTAEQLAATVTAWFQDASERSRIGENGRRTVDENRGALAELLAVVVAQLAR